MNGIENVGLAAPIFAEQADHVLIKPELGFGVVSEIIESEFEDFQGNKSFGLQATGYWQYAPKNTFFFRPSE